MSLRLATTFPALIIKKDKKHRLKKSHKHNLKRRLDNREISQSMRSLQEKRKSYSWQREFVDEYDTYQKTDDEMKADCSFLFDKPPAHYAYIHYIVSTSIFVKATLYVDSLLRLMDMRDDEAYVTIFQNNTGAKFINISRFPDDLGDENLEYVDGAEEVGYELGAYVKCARTDEILWKIVLHEGIPEYYDDEWIIGWRISVKSFVDKFPYHHAVYSSENPAFKKNIWLEMQDWLKKEMEKKYYNKF